MEGWKGRKQVAEVAGWDQLRTGHTLLDDSLAVQCSFFFFFTK